MKLFGCFGGSAAVVDDDDDAAGGTEAAAVLAARRHQRERARSRSFRGNFFLFGSSKGKTKKPSAAVASRPAPEVKRLGVEATDDDAACGLTRASSSVPSSAPLSSATSMDPNSSSSSRSSPSASSSSVSSSPSASGALVPPPAAKRQGSTTTSPAAGAAAVVLCLLMVVFCGRVGATVLTSTVLYLFPLRWHARTTGNEDGVGLLECDADEEEAAKRKGLRRGVSW